MLDPRSNDGQAGDGGGGRRRSPWSDVPYRTILATIGLVFASLLAVYVVYLASRIVIWIAVAGFFAVVLSRPVGALQHRFGLRRGLAIAVVVGSTVLLAAGLMVLFVLPVRRQLSIDDISSGRRGGLRSHAGAGGRRRAQLYEEARRKRIPGRSKMTKAELERAVED